MIKAVFFDLDGVLTKEYNSTETICRNLHRSFPSISLATLSTHFRNDCSYLMESGGSYADSWDSFCQHIGQSIPPKTLREALQTVTPNEEMLALVRTLSEKYTTGIITDNTLERMNLLRKSMALDALFRPIINSADIHAMKHDGSTTIFDAALKAAQCEASEAFFIDNQQRNLVTPENIGMKTYWHDDKKNDIPALRKALQELGIDLV